VKACHKNLVGQTEVCPTETGHIALPPCDKLDSGEGARFPMTTVSLSARLSEITLPDADERPVRLGSLWESQLAVIVFLRHYG